MATTKKASPAPKTTSKTPDTSKGQAINKSPAPSSGKKPNKTTPKTANVVVPAVTTDSSGKVTKTNQKVVVANTPVPPPPAPKKPASKPPVADKAAEEEPKQDDPPVEVPEVNKLYQIRRYRIGSEIVLVAGPIVGMPEHYQAIQPFEKITWVMVGIRLQWKPKRNNAKVDLSAVDMTIEDIEANGNLIDVAYINWQQFKQRQRDNSPD